MNCQTYEPEADKGMIPINCGSRIASTTDRERLEAGLMQRVLTLHHTSRPTCTAASVSSPTATI